MSEASPLLPDTASEWSPRKRKLYEFLAQEGYVCDVGRDFARRDLLDVTELAPDQSDDDAYRQIETSVQKLVREHRSGLIVIFPKEPENYEELKTMKQARHADVVAAALMESILQKRGDVECALKTVRLPTGSPRADGPWQRKALGAATPALAVALHQRVTKSAVYPTEADTAGIRTVVNGMLKEEPSLVPMYDKDGLFSIVLSSAYVDENETERKAAREFFGIENIPHQRYSPVTCLFVNWHSEIARLMQTPTGEAIQNKKVRSPYYLNPNETLADPYKRFDKMFDTYMLCTYRIMNAIARELPEEVAHPLKQMEKMKIQQLYRQQNVLLGDRLLHLHGRMSNEEFEKKCRDWDRFLQAQLLADQEMMLGVMGIGAPPSIDPTQMRDMIAKPVSPPALEPKPARAVTIRNEEPRIGRNEQCSCGSGKKYKQCCGKKK